MFEESAAIPSIWASMNSWFTPTVLFVLLNLMIGTILFSSSLSNQQQQQQQEEAHDDPHQPKIARSPSVLQRLRSINLYAYRSQEHHPSPAIPTLFKETPDSDTHYPSEQTHNQQQSIETHSQYLFAQTHQPQTLEPQTQYLFEQTHQEQAQSTQTQFVFEQTDEESTLKTQTQYVVEHTHEEEEEKEEEDGEPRTLDEVYSQLTDGHVSRTTSDTKPASGEVPAKLPAKMRKSASLKSAFGHFEENPILETRRPATVREARTRVTEEDHEVDAKADDFINKFKQQLKLQRLDSIIRYKEVISRGSGK